MEARWVASLLVACFDRRYNEPCTNDVEISLFFLEFDVHRPRL